MDRLRGAGTVRFFGLAEFSAGEWVGIELDEAIGKNNGSAFGVTYFSCPMNKGIFVRPTCVVDEQNAGQWQAGRAGSQPPAASRAPVTPRRSAASAEAPRALTDGLPFAGAAAAAELAEARRRIQELEAQYRRKLEEAEGQARRIRDLEAEVQEQTSMVGLYRSRAEQAESQARRIPELEAEVQKQASMVGLYKSRAEEAERRARELEAAPPAPAEAAPPQAPPAATEAAPPQAERRAQELEAAPPAPAETALEAPSVSTEVVPPQVRRVLRRAASEPDSPMLQGPTVALSLTGTLVEPDASHGLPIDGLTSPAVQLLKELTLLSAKVVYFTFDQDWEHVLNLVSKVRERPVKYKFFIAQHAQRKDEMWAFRMEPPTQLINWQATSPEILLQATEAVRAEAVTSFEEDCEAECYCLAGDALPRFVAALLRRGDVLLRAARAPGGDFFQGREAGPCKVLAVSDELPTLAFDDHPEDWDLRSPGEVVVVTTPLSGAGEPTNLVGHLREFVLKHRPQTLLPEGVPAADALVLNRARGGGRYLALWLEPLSAAAGPWTKRPLNYMEVDLLEGTQSSRRHATMLLQQSLGAVLQLWGEEDITSVEVTPFDGALVDQFVKKVQQNGDAKTRTAVAAGAFTVRVPEAERFDRPQPLSALADACQQALNMCGCPAKVLAVCMPKPDLVHFLTVVGKIGDLHTICDKVLHDGCDRALALKLALGPAAVDKAAFAALYQRLLRQLLDLTPHQREKLGQVEAGGGDVHLQAPAGGGKTFLGVRFMLESLKGQVPTSRELAKRASTGEAAEALVSSSSKAIVLYAAPSEALCLNLLAWLAAREPGRLEQLLQRLLLWCPAFGPQLRRAAPAAGGLELEGLPTAPQADLVVVDEAQRLQGDAQLASLLEGLRGGARLVLLSDKAKCDKNSVVFPGDFQEVLLEEVVRSTRMLVAVSTVFQGVPEEQRARCQHGSGGPPVRSYLFPAAATAAERMSRYADKVAEALVDLRSTLKNLDFSHRVLIVGPDAEFMAALIGECTRLEALAPFAFAGAAALAAAPGRGGSAPPAAGAEGAEGTERQVLVADSIDAVDGLECLVALVVGLDREIGTPEARAAARSRIYRGVTRAQMFLAIVQEHIPGGMLEFLSQVTLKGEHGILHKWEAELRPTYDATYAELRGPKPFCWSEEDIKRHNAAVDELTRHVPATARPVAFFLAGGPGAGKGYVNTFFRQEGYLPKTAAHINCDDIRRFCPAWDADTQVPKAPETVAATQVEAGFIAELAAVRCVQSRRSFVFDSTLRNAAWILKFAQGLKDLSENELRIVIVHVDTRNDTVKDRVEKREATGRAVDPDFAVELNDLARDTTAAMERESEKEASAINFVVSVQNNGTLEFADLDSDKGCMRLKADFVKSRDVGPDGIQDAGCSDPERLGLKRDFDEVAQDDGGEQKKIFEQMMFDTSYGCSSTAWTECKFMPFC